MEGVKLGSIRMWANGVVGVIVNMNQMCFLVITQDGSEQQIPRNLPCKPIQLKPPLRRAFETVGQRYIDIMKAEMKIQELQMRINENTMRLSNERGGLYNAWCRHGKDIWME